MTMPRATRRPLRDLDKGRYECPRCGGIRACHAGRPRPQMCRDCQESVRELAALEAALAAGEAVLDDGDDYSDLVPGPALSGVPAYQW